MSNKDTQSGGGTGESAEQTATFGIGGTASGLQVVISSGEEAKKRRQQSKNTSSKDDKDKGGK